MEFNFKGLSLKWPSCRLILTFLMVIDVSVSTCKLTNNHKCNGVFIMTVHVHLWYYVTGGGAYMCDVTIQVISQKYGGLLGSQKVNFFFSSTCICTTTEWSFFCLETCIWSIRTILEGCATVSLKYFRIYTVVHMQYFGVFCIPVGLQVCVLNSWIGMLRSCCWHSLTANTVGNRHFSLLRIHL